MGALSKFKELCVFRNAAILRMEKDCGFSNASIKALKTEDVSFNQVVKIARFFNFPLEYFCDEEFNVDSDEQALLSIYDSFSDEGGRKKLLNYARDPLDAGRYIKIASMDWWKIIHNQGG